MGWFLLNVQILNFALLQFDTEAHDGRRERATGAANESLTAQFEENQRK